MGTGYDLGMSVRKLLSRGRSLLERHPTFFSIYGVSATLVLWTTLHVGVWIFASQDPRHDLPLPQEDLWPYFSNASEWGIRFDDAWKYDRAEFFVWVVVPWVAFALYVWLRRVSNAKAR